MKSTKALKSRCIGSAGECKNTLVIAVHGWVGKVAGSNHNAEVKGIPRKISRRYTITNIPIKINEIINKCNTILFIKHFVKTNYYG
jgi:hypothetical protein